MAHQPVQTSITANYSKLEPDAQQKQLRSRDRVWGGWRTTVFTGVIVTLIALIINIVILIWASATRPPDSHAGAGVVTLYNGSCKKMDKIFTWSHLGVNVVSTLLLSAGNACMQCLSAPTREEVDKAHAQNTWLEIGIPNIRNFRRIAIQRRVLWGLLALSSLPLHLFYNSVIFSTTSSNDYSAVMVADDFLHSGSWNGDLSSSSSWNDLLKNSTWPGGSLNTMNSSQIQYLQDNLASLVKLDNDDCVKTYQASLISNYRSVLLVMKTSNTTNAVLGFIPQLVGDYQADTGTCSNSFTCWDGSDKNATDWTFTWYPGNGFQPPNLGAAQSDLEKKYNHTSVSVDYCLAESASQGCTISLSRVYLAVVIICNAIKLACIVSTLALKGYQPLITIGDAIESFVVYPDPMTKATTLSASEVRKHESIPRWSMISARAWFPYKHTWFEAASARRWAITSLCLLVVWVGALALLIKGAEIYSEYPDIWRNGLGELDVNSILTFSKGIGVTTDVLIVNSPQVVLSFIYMMYNGLFTCMLLSAECLKFATQRKSLRVSCPRKGQRSTYWLQLPYRYAIPFLIAMGTLHWLVSQSIFLVRIAVINQEGNADYGREIGGCGWSPDALIATVVLGALIILTLFGFGMRKLPDGMPVVSSSSAAISAACHRAEGEGEGIVLLPLQYGVFKGGEDGVPQVGFSAEEVEPLEEETIYGSRNESYGPHYGVDDY